MTQPNSVPQLNLAPQLNRPLSLWNPFDYLRFLYWIFFFPQALRWYEEQYPIDNKSNQIKLWIQGLLLTAIIPTSICKLLEEIGYSINWSGVYFGVVLGVVTVIAVQQIIYYIVIVDRISYSDYEDSRHSWIVYAVTWSIIYSGLLSVAYGMLPNLGLNGFWVWLGSIFLGFFLSFIVQVWFNWGLDLAYTLPQSISILIYVLKFLVLPDTLLFIVSLIAKTYGIAYGIPLLMISIFIYFVGLFGRTMIKFAVMSSIIIGIVLCILLIFNQSYYESIVLGKGYTYLLEAPWFILLYIGLFLIVLRPGNWLTGSALNRYNIKNKSFLFPRITPIPLPFLTSRLATWLKQDWLLGLHNANELLRYSHQFIPVVKAVNQVLHETPPEHLIFRVSQLATNPTDWQIVKYASVSLSKQLKTGGIERDTRLDTPPHAIAAGFWYLHEQEPDKAMDAFETVRSFPYCEEMFILAQTLYQLQKATNYSKFSFYLDFDYENDNNHSESDREAKTLKKLQNIAGVKLPIFPSEPLLRPTTWKVLNSLRSVIHDIQFIIGETSNSTHNAALNRAINKLQTILDNSDAIPEAEQQLIVNLTLEVKAVLDEITSKY